MASRWRRRGHRSVDVHAGAAAAWAAPPGPPAGASGAAEGQRLGRRRPLSARTTGAPLVHKDSTSSSESIKFVGSVPPPKRETADERGQTAMMVALRAWVTKQPQKKQLMSEVHHFLDGPPGIDQTAGAHDQSGRKTCINPWHEVPEAAGAGRRRLGARRPQTYCTECVDRAAREGAGADRGPGNPVEHGPVARASRGGAGAHALEPLLDAVVGEAPARSVVGFVPERLGPSALQGDRLACEQSAKNEEASQALIQKLARRGPVSTRDHLPRASLGRLRGPRAPRSIRRLPSSRRDVGSTPSS